MARKTTKAEREEAIGILREMLPPGSTVHTVLRHTARSGMMRSIDAYHVTERDGQADHRWLSRLISKATGISFDERRESLKMDGAGQDMGYAIIHDLGYTLYPDGFTCTGTSERGQRNRCPSNDHSNGDRDYSPHQHGAGGYALNHEWI